MNQEEPINVKPVPLPFVLPTKSGSGIPTRSVKALQVERVSKGTIPSTAILVLGFRVEDGDGKVELLHLALTPGAAHQLARALKKSVKKAMLDYLDYTPETE